MDGTLEFFKPPLICPFLGDFSDLFRNWEMIIIVHNFAMQSISFPYKIILVNHGVGDRLGTQTTMLPSSNSSRNTELPLNSRSRCWNSRHISCHLCQIRISALILLPPSQRGLNARIIRDFDISIKVTSLFLSRPFSEDVLKLFIFIVARRLKQQGKPLTAYLRSSLKGIKEFFPVRNKS